MPFFDLSLPFPAFSLPSPCTASQAHGADAAASGVAVAQARETIDSLSQRLSAAEVAHKQLAVTAAAAGARHEAVERRLGGAVSRAEQQAERSAGDAEAATAALEADLLRSADRELRAVAELKAARADVAELRAGLAAKPPLHCRGCGRLEEQNLALLLDMQVLDMPTTLTILEQYGPNHLGL